MAEAPLASAPAFLDVTRASDGRYCVVYTRAGVGRRSYASSAGQVVGQAQRAGGLPVRTDDEALRGHCREAGLMLLAAGQEG